jgi:UPF0271 protein
MVNESRVVAIDGTVIALDAQSICIHGDTPAAVSIARTLRQTLEARGVELKSFVDMSS